MNYAILILKSSFYKEKLCASIQLHCEQDSDLRQSEPENWRQSAVGLFGAASERQGGPTPTRRDRRHTVNAPYLAELPTHRRLYRLFQDRKATLLNLVEQAMGKQAVAAGEPVGEEDAKTDDEDCD